MCQNLAHTQPGTEKAFNVELNFQFNLVGASPLFFFSVILYFSNVAGDFFFDLLVIWKCI